MKTHIYTRIDVPDLNKLNEQKNLINDYTKDQGLDTVYYSDIEPGFTIKDRPGLERLMNNLNDGDLIITTDLGRLAQTIEDGLFLRRRFIKQKILLICLDFSGDFLSEENLEIFIDTLNNYKKETKLALERSPSKTPDEKPRSRPPFGWKCVGKNLDYQEVPEQQRVIKKILSLRDQNTKDSKYSRIAKRLNEDGDNLTIALNKPNPKSGYRFYAQSIIRIIEVNCELHVGKSIKSSDNSMNSLIEVD